MRGHGDNRAPPCGPRGRSSPDEPASPSRDRAARALLRCGRLAQLAVRRWTSSHLGGEVAAWTFLTTRWVLWEWGPVAPNYVVLPYFPLIVLLVATPAARLGDALRLVPLLVLQGLTSIYVAAAAMVPAGLIAAGRVVRRSPPAP